MNTILRLLGIILLFMWTSLSSPLFWFLYSFLCHKTLLRKVYWLIKYTVKISLVVWNIFKFKFTYNCLDGICSVYVFYYNVTTKRCLYCVHLCYFRGVNIWKMSKQKEQPLDTLNIIFDAAKELLHLYPISSSSRR